MLGALRRQPVDRLPTQSNYTRAMGRLLSAHFGIAEAELPERLGNHLLRVDIDHTRRMNVDGSIEFDWWGAGWDTRTEGYWHAFSPLKDSLDLDGYPWPDPADEAILVTAERTILRHGADDFIVPNLGMCLFERAWSLRGFDTLLMDMVERTEWVEDLLDRITKVCREKGIPARMLENFSVGLNHAEVGALIAKKWNFPEQLITAIRFHHDPTQCPPANRDIVYCVYLANSICDIERERIGFDQISSTVLRDFGIETEDQLNVIQQKLAKLFDDQRSKFQ